MFIIVSQPYVYCTAALRYSLCNNGQNIISSNELRNNNIVLEVRYSEDAQCGCSLHTVSGTMDVLVSLDVQRDFDETQLNILSNRLQLQACDQNNCQYYYSEDRHIFSYSHNSEINQLSELTEIILLMAMRHTHSAFDSIVIRVEGKNKNNI